jgi:putative NIF3 family GTP cyclohydrolase 1 type 2
VLLEQIQKKLDQFFEVKELDEDPTFSRFIPMVYDPIKFDWLIKFENDFTQRFNGLMIKGSPEVENIFLAVFPTDEVISSFIEDAFEGDLLFMHHPITMECGDPKGLWGRGFIPMNTRLIDKLIEKKLSVYTCHAPLDYNRKVSTSDAIAEALKANIVGEFCKYGNGNAGLICDIPATNTKQLIDKLIDLFEIPYVDFEGKEHNEMSKIAIIAGCGDVVADMKFAESNGAQAYITGEIHCHIDNEFGRKKYEIMQNYILETNMSLIGLSHAASEFFVMKSQMKNWLEQEMDINIKLIRQSSWWV